MLDADAPRDVDRTPGRLSDAQGAHLQRVALEGDVDGTDGVGRAERRHPRARRHAQRGRRSVERPARRGRERHAPADEVTAREGRELEPARNELEVDHRGAQRPRGPLLPQLEGAVRVDRAAERRAREVV